jgi:hypothetical protein
MKKRKFHISLTALETIILIILLIAIFLFPKRSPEKDTALNTFTETYTAYRIDTPEGNVIILDIEYEFCEISSPTLDEDGLPFLPVACWVNAKERTTGAEPAWVGRAGKITEIKTYNIMPQRKELLTNHP